MWRDIWHEGRHTRLADIGGLVAAVVGCGAGYLVAWLSGGWF